MIILLVITLAGLSVGLLAITSSSLKETGSAKESISTRLIAEAGLNAAYLDLRTGGTGNVGTSKAPIAFDGATYFATAANAGGARIQLTATGRNQTSQSRVTMTVVPQSSPFFQWALFGRDGVQMSSNSTTDSFDSAKGSYASQAIYGSGSSKHAASDGEVGSNSSITLSQNARVFGDATPGPSSTTSVLGNATLTGSNTPEKAPVDMPAIDLPSVKTSGALTVSKNKATTIGPGTFHYSNLLCDTGSTLTVVGPTVLICDSFQLGSGTNFIVNGKNGGVHLFVVDNFNIASNVAMHSLTNTPSDLRIDLESDNVLDPGIDVNFVPDTIGFASNSYLYGTVYAPNADVTISSNFQLYGSLVARGAHLSSNCQVHYDESLKTKGPMGPPHYAKLSFRVLQ